MSWDRNFIMSEEMLQINQDFIVQQDDLVLQMQICLDNYTVWEDSLVDFKTAPEFDTIYASTELCPDNCSDIRAGIDALVIDSHYLGDISILQNMVVTQEELDLFAANLAFMTPINEDWIKLSGKTLYPIT